MQRYRTNPNAGASISWYANLTTLKLMPQARTTKTSAGWGKRRRHVDIPKV